MRTTPETLFVRLVSLESSRYTNKQTNLQADDAEDDAEDRTENVGYAECDAEDYA